MDKTKVTIELLEELGFVQKDNKWIHKKGTFIYCNNIPEYLVDLVNIMTGTAFRKGQTKLENGSN